ncbi:hypothetical protein BBAD15_g4190 [Beauveria bassiana D1-5]|uniref:Uncharacterized protein n=1 Tax=Beauveria bassiana D1-5 TaxID=1245745 RepID=A0A0A2VWB3_BEABA|nr:hypothetical protein BBAD15_g4190 [Beauveria bassiana D1-5]
MDAGSQSLNMRFWSRRETISRPGLWSSEDLQLFGCQFSAIHAFDPQSCEAAGADDSSDHAVVVEREALVLQKAYWPTASSIDIAGKPGPDWQPRDEKLTAVCGAREPPLCIGKRVIGRASFSFFLPVEKQHLARGGLLPMTGCIDYRMISGAREKAVICGPRPRQRRCSYSERLKRITPRVWTEDPYILFILLSMAQHQYHSKRGRRCTAFRASLFVTNSAFRQDIYLFDADIPAALLDELQDPRIVPQRPTRLVIHGTRISIEPRKDLWARLVAALSSRGGDNAADGVGRRDGEERRDVERRQDVERQGDGADEEGCERQET